MILTEIKNKIEHYCAYQERCHREVKEKLRSFFLTSDEIDEIIVHLIENNFLNEERFAINFSRGKFRIKNWGKIRIESELKARNISKTIITKSLKEISVDDYIEVFNCLAEKQWESIRETNLLKKKKKFIDYLLRKGWESDLIYEKLNDLVTSETNLD